MQDPTCHPRRTRPRSGPAFTLIESLVASTLLGVVVLAVLSAVSASQSMAFEGQKQILAAMAADDLMAELVMLPYAELKSHHGLHQPLGQLTTLSQQPYPDTYWALERSVEVVERTITDPGAGVQIKGADVTVRASDSFRVLAQLETFIPEPPQ
ncbi:MAG: prepilin-type N-terminal cleavage/methylation domain-containing protein [Planctomycetota bacterium]|nr:prepilin-type N-terminal cleavage/methylation domain-containing protein [Planctomycetota bacterium]